MLSLICRDRSICVASCVVFVLSQLVTGGVAVSTPNDLNDSEIAGYSALQLEVETRQSPARSGHSDAQSTLSQNTVSEGEQYTPIEFVYQPTKRYQDPFNEVELDLVFIRNDGQRWRVPAFWDGGNIWKARFSPLEPGDYRFHWESTDKSDVEPGGHEQSLRVAPYRGTNSLLVHGPLRVSDNRRYFQYADGTPFFWLADTWWEGLCRRISLEDIKTLAADRQAKGFSVVQIVAGLYSDQPPFDDRAKNEGGLVWEPQFTRINPAYFDAADPRIRAIVDSQLAAAIVGSWGYYFPLMGMDKMKKHWRNLVARYGAYPVVWIMAGEVSMPYYLSPHPKEDSELQVKAFTALAKYVRSIDPYHHLITIHPQHSGREELLDDTALDFDMLQTGHESWSKAANTVSWISAHYSKTPPMPVLVGETVYEGTQQTNWQDTERFAFWVCMMNGAAGHTYGAGGIWQMNTKAIPHGPSPWGVTYENTPWDEAMQMPGSKQVGIGKSILMKYPWWRFHPHPEWVEQGGTTFQKPHVEWFDVNKRWDQEKGDYLLPYASGISKEIRFIYIPPRTYDAWGPLVKGVETDVGYHASYYDPVTGEQYLLGRLFRPELTQVAEDSFNDPKKLAWLDSGDQTSVQNGKLLARGSTWTVLKDMNESDVLVRVDAQSNAEAGILIRFHDRDNSIVAVYSPSLKGIWIQDRQKGQYGLRLGYTDVAEIGPKMRMTAEAHGTNASFTITDGEHTYRTTPVQVQNNRAGSAGLWSESLSCDDFDGWGGCRTMLLNVPAPNHQAFSDAAAYKVDAIPPDANPNLVIENFWRAPNVPITHDWVLVLEH